LALSSDAPCTPWFEPDSPFYSIYAAVTRKAANGMLISAAEGITVNQAVLAYTKWAAIIGGFSQNGELKAGKKADFVILSDNIFKVPYKRIKDIQVIETWVNGKKVYHT
jgi:predicted amidohydrolase YtcJ